MSTRVPFCIAGLITAVTRTEPVARIAANVESARILTAHEARGAAGQHQHQHYGSVPLNNPRQLQESFGFARYLCSSPFIEVNTNVEQRYKNAQLNCAEVEPPVYFRWDLMGDL